MQALQDLVSDAPASPAAEGRRERFAGAPGGGSFGPVSDTASLIAAIPDAVVVVGSDGIVRFVNPAAQALLGDRGRDLVGQQLGFAVSTGHVAEIELMVHGEPRLAQLRVVECLWERQPALLAMMRDVEEEARLEARLKSERALADRRLREALDAASSAILLVDMQSTVIHANLAATRLFETPREALASGDFGRLFGFTGSIGAFEEAIGTRRRRQFGLRSDGSKVPLDIGFTHFGDSGGTVVMLSLSDVTRLVEQEESLRERNEQLSRLNDELSQFASSVSHDLKAPLTTITGLLQLCRDDLAAGDVENAREMLAGALDTCHRHARLIEGVLAVARAGRLDVGVEWIEVEPECRLIWGDVTGSMPRPPRLDLDLEPGLVVRTERATLMTILQNLLSNAVRFADASKAETWVAIAGRRIDGRLILDVADNGIGIPRAVQPRVFGMFNRFSEASGSGLGLALVRKHVERLKGCISFTSDATGTRFRLELPLIEEHP